MVDSRTIAFTKDTQLNKSIYGSRHFRQVCSLLVTFAMLFAILSIPVYSEASDPAEASAPAVGVSGGAGDKLMALAKAVLDPIGTTPVHDVNFTSVGDTGNKSKLTAIITDWDGTKNVSVFPTTANEGVKIEFSATPIEGYHIEKWEVNTEKLSITDYTYTHAELDRAIDVIVYFKEDTVSTVMYDVDFNVVGSGGTVSAKNGTDVFISGKVPADTVLKFTAAPNNVSYRVKQWKINGKPYTDPSPTADPNVIEVKITEQTTVSVEFEAIPNEEKELSVFTPVYLSAKYIYGTGIPLAEISVIRYNDEGAQSEATKAKVDENGMWKAPMPGEPSVSKVKSVFSSVKSAAEQHVSVLIIQKVDGVETDGIEITEEDSNNGVPPDKLYIIRYITVDGKAIDGYKQDDKFETDYSGYLTYLEVETNGVVKQYEVNNPDKPYELVPDPENEHVITVNVIFKETFVKPKLKKYTVKYGYNGTDGEYIDEYPETLVGSKITVNALKYGPNEGYEFKYWKILAGTDPEETTGNNPLEYKMPDADVIFTAYWDEIDVEQPGAGGGSGGSGRGPGMAEPKTTDTAKPGDGPDGVSTLPAKILPRFTLGMENGFIPLSAFIPEHIAYLYGYKEGDVQPDAYIMRSHAAALIFRILSAPDKDNPLDNPFEFKDWEWYTQAVAYLTDTGIIVGYKDGSFRPDDYITRAEYVAMICRFDNKMGPYPVDFNDISGHWAERYIKIGASNGWISGYEDGSFKPDDNITRAEVVSLINRLLYRGIEIEDIPDWAPSFTDLKTTHWAYADIMEAAIGHEFERKDNGYEVWINPID